jgi:hypothetical protein
MTTVQTLFQKPRILLEKKPQLLVRLVIIGTVLLISMYMAYRAARVSKLIWTFYHPIPVLTVVILAAFWFLRYPRAGLLIFLPSLTFVTVDIGTGSDTSIGTPVLLLGLLIGLWLFDMFARERSIKIFTSSALPAALAFLMVGYFLLLFFGDFPGSQPG